MLSALPMLAARSLRRLGVVLALLGSLGGLALVNAHPAAAYAPLDQAASFESVNYPGRYMRHRAWVGEVTPLASDLDRKDASFVVRPGLNGNPGSVSFESVNYPNHYLRHQGWRVRLAGKEDTALFKGDATFMPRARGSQWRFESVNYWGHFIRHRNNFQLWLDKDEPTNTLFQKDSTWRNALVPPCANAGTAVTATTVRAVEDAIACLTNQERQKVPGLGLLAANATLQATARAHSQDMVQRRFDGHTNPDGLAACDRITRAGYIWTACGENIWSLYPTATASGFVQSWMGSTDHRKNILSADYAEIGVGVAAGTFSGGPGSAGGTATQNFGRGG